MSDKHKAEPHWHENSDYQRRFSQQLVGLHHLCKKPSANYPPHTIGNVPHPLHPSDDADPKRSVSKYFEWRKNIDLQSACCFSSVVEEHPDKASTDGNGVVSLTNTDVFIAGETHALVGSDEEYAWLDRHCLHSPAR